MQTRYTIKATNRIHTLTEDHGICVTSSCDFFEGLTFGDVCQLLKMKGWTLIHTDNNVNVFDFRDAQYKIQWNQGQASITKDGEEISWLELPEQLKGLL